MIIHHDGRDFTIVGRRGDEIVAVQPETHVFIAGRIADGKLHGSWCRTANECCARAFLEWRPNYCDHTKG